MRKKTKFIRKEEQVAFKDKWEYLELFMDFQFYKSKQIKTKMKNYHFSLNQIGLIKLFQIKLKTINM